MRGRKRIYLELQDITYRFKEIWRQFARVNKYHNHINILKGSCVHSSYILIQCLRDCLIPFCRCADKA